MDLTLPGNLAKQKQIVIHLLNTLSMDRLNSVRTHHPEIISSITTVLKLYKLKVLYKSQPYSELYSFRYKHGYYVSIYHNQILLNKGCNPSSLQ